MPAFAGRPGTRSCFSAAPTSTAHPASSPPRRRACRSPSIARASTRCRPTSIVASASRSITSREPRALANRRLTQELFRHLDAAGHHRAAHSSGRPIRPTDGRFLPDRYVVGTCPHCGSPNARGDQCESCTRLLDPDDLVVAALGDLRRDRCRVSRDAPPVPEAVGASRAACAMDRRRDATGRRWCARSRTKWLDEGLQDRCITRDLDWGVPVPKPGFEDKVFYVWFDAPIGYIAAAIEWSEAAPGRDWRDWWQGGDDVHLPAVPRQGQRALPRHQLPRDDCSARACRSSSSDIIKGFNWLTFEGGKFSTSGQRGIFTDTALDAAAGRQPGAGGSPPTRRRRPTPTSPSSASSTA